jgi:hypothetical protein
MTTAGTTMTERGPVRLPAHVFVMLGASTGAYAIALAAVAGLQSADEAALVAARGPVAQAVEDVSASRDALLVRLDRARAAYAAAAQSYVAAGGTLEALEGRLGALAAKVAEIDGASRALPTSVRLPKVAGSIAGSRAPATHATTGASGG